MAKRPHSDLDEYKIQASILLKQFRSTVLSESKQATGRLKSLPQFSDLPAEEILGLGRQIKLKHALQTIAIEHGHETWVAFKTALEFKAKRHIQKKSKPFAHLYPKRCQGFLNQWFGQYASAKHYLNENGGYLLPYDSQFFVCQSDYIEALDLNPNDRDWKKIAYDWAKPANQTAWKRLNNTLTKYEEQSSGGGE